MANPITFKELLNHTTGKANASRQEFESAMASRGYTTGDIRKLGKAFDRVKDSGNEYVLHPEKGFNVYDPTNKQLSGSGKKKGNKAGFDLGDLIGLGGDVSLLAGALRNEVKGYNESKTPKTAEVKPESVASIETAAKASASNPSTQTTTQKSKVKSSGVGSQANKSREPKDFDLSDFIKAPQAQSTKGPDISENLYGEPTLPATAKKKQTSEAKGFNWGDAIIGDATTLFDTENYKDLAALYNPIKFFNQPIADWSNNRLNARAERNQQEWEAEHSGEDYHKREVSSPIPNLGLLTPFRKRIPTSRRLMPPGGNTKALGGRMTEYEKGGLIPTETDYPILKTNDIGELMGTEEGDILLSGRDGLKLTPTETNYPALRVNDIGELIPTEEGEILMSGRKGMKIPDMKGLMLYGDKGIKFNIDDLLTKTKSPSGSPDVSLLDWKPDFNATQEEQAPGRGINPEGNLGKGKGLDWSNVASGLVKYGVPAAYLGAEQNQIHNLRSMINPHLKAPDLMVGAVKDLSHPDFSLPYQPGMEGSSLGEAQASGLSRAKFQRENQNEWELKNALNKQEQQNHIIDRLNQNAILKTQIGNQEAMIKSGNAMNEFGYLLQDRGQTAGSLFQNLDSGITGHQIAKDRNSTLAATHIIENANSSLEDVAWAKEVLGINKPVRKKGGKLSKTKTKFSRAYA